MSLLERVRQAVAPDYEVERELGGGGMGLVFLGREPALDRPVAIKVLRPDIATAAAADRFLREARLLASVAHPNIVAIHRVAESGGLFYFVMELLGGSLDARLREGRLGAGEAAGVGVGLLRGLEKVHERGIVHRDVKPSNVFLRDDVPVLGDFGIAKLTTSTDSEVTQPGRAVGTLAYMAPEQLAGGEVTALADIYAVGMVLYEAVTGRRWAGIGDPEHADWRGVPPRLAAVLRRALALEPNRRWPNAGAFAAALDASAAGRRPGRVVMATVAAVAAVVVLILGRGGPGREELPVADLAVVPLVSAPGDSVDAIGVAQAATLHLENAFPGSTGDTLRVAPMRLVGQWWDRLPTHDSLPPSAWDDLHVRRIAWGRLTRRGDTLAVQVELRSPDGTVQPVAQFTGASADAMGLGLAIAQALVRVVVPQRAPRFVGSPLRGRNSAALDTLMAGDRAFWSENWSAAERFYRRAIALDSTLGQAWWGLYNVERWRRVPFDVDLARVYAAYSQDLPAIDALLIRADLATGAERLAGYRAAVEAYPYDGYAWLLFGNELFHRGALIGVGLDSGIAVLRTAVRRNPYMAPAYSTLAWALIRQGVAAPAREALARYAQLASPITEAEFCFECVLELVWGERFAPDRAAAGRSQLLNTPMGPESLSRALRWGLAFGVPAAQATVGGMLASGAPDPVGRADALTAQALALLALGRVETALVHLDSAATIARDPELSFQASQWPVALAALEIPGVPQRTRELGRAALASRVDDPRFGLRARWTLVLDALAGGDTTGARRWMNALAGDDSLTARLRTLATAVSEGTKGRAAEAVLASDALRFFAAHGRLGDPFARAALYLGRGRWLAPVDPKAADRAWLWYENADLSGWPTGAPQEAEIDWALETYGRYRRGMLAVAAGDHARACTLLPDVVTRWGHADSAYAALQRRAAEAVARCIH